MSQPMRDVEAEALALPARERARLAHRLLESLEGDSGEDAAAVERAWEEEIARRLAEYRSGGAQTISAGEVVAEARARLRRE